jgi:hypothetical protein
VFPHEGNAQKDRTLVSIPAAAYSELGDFIGVELYCTGTWNNYSGYTLDTGVVTRADVLDGKWHLIAATYDGSYMKIYPEGALDESFDIWDHMNINNEPLYIGDPSIVN